MNRPSNCWLTLLLALSLLPAARAETSLLWGAQGERWTPQSRLPDFSRAGFRSGESPLPTPPVAVSVKAFGAKGDGKTDDTAAFRSAVADPRSGVIEVPAGRYLLTDVIEVRRPGVVLRGAGRDRTVLFFPKPLEEIHPHRSATTEGRPTSAYSWDGGFVSFRGRTGGERLARVTAPASRGDVVLQVSTTNGLRVGRRVEFFQRDTDDNSLAAELYSGDIGDGRNLRGHSHVSLVCRVIGLESNQVRLDRPLRCDVQPGWEPELRRFEPTVTNSGVEDLAFEFPVTPYLGHFTELGFNAILFSEVADCWARNIRVVNPDSGVIVRAQFCTVQDFVFETSRRPDTNNCTGHHGVYFYNNDNLFTGFDFRMRFIHDITVSQSAGNVFSQGKGVDLCFDHHRRAPYENLFSDIDVGAGTRLWRSGGGRGYGKNCGARGTFWNIRAQRPMPLPPAAFGAPTLNLIGCFIEGPSTVNGEGLWFEAIAPAKLAPADLHTAQLARRLGPLRN